MGTGAVATNGDLLSLILDFHRPSQAETLTALARIAKLFNPVSVSTLSKFFLEIYFSTDETAQVKLIKSNS